MYVWYVLLNSTYLLIPGVWGQSPQRGPGAEPLVRGLGGRSLPEAESILVIGCPTEPANLAPVRENSCFVTVHWCQSWGAQSAWCPPTPSLGGPVPPPPPPGSAAYAPDQDRGLEDYKTDGQCKQLFVTELNYAYFSSHLF